MASSNANFWYHIRIIKSEEAILDKLTKILPNLGIELANYLQCSGCGLSFFDCWIEEKLVISFENGVHNCMMCRSDKQLCHSCCYWGVDDM